MNFAVVEIVQDRHFGIRPIGGWGVQLFGVEG